MQIQDRSKSKINTSFNNLKIGMELVNPLKVEIVDINKTNQTLQHIILEDINKDTIKGFINDDWMIRLIIDPIIEERLPISISIFKGRYTKQGLLIGRAIIDSEYPVSASLFNKYRHCPRLIYLNDYLSIWQMLEFPLVRGNLEHEILGQLYPNFNDLSFKNKDELLKTVLKAVNHILKTKWYLISAIGMSESESIKKIIHPERMVASLWYNRDFVWPPELDQKYYTEVRVQSPLYGLKGVIDRIEENEHGIAIAEIKTGKKYPDKIASAFMQAAVYGLILDHTADRSIGMLKVEMPDLDFHERFEFLEYKPKRILEELVPVRNDIYYYLIGGNGESHSIAPFDQCKPFCYSRSACEFYCRINRILTNDEDTCNQCSHREPTRLHDPCVYPILLDKKKIHLPYSYFKWFEDQLDQIRQEVLNKQKLFFGAADQQELQGNGFAGMELIKQNQHITDYKLIFRKAVRSDKPTLIPPSRLRTGERVLITPKNHVPLSEFSLFGIIANLDHKKLTIVTYDKIPDKNLKRAYDEQLDQYIFRIDSYPMDTISRQKEALDILLRGPYFNKPKHLELYSDISRIQETLFLLKAPKFRKMQCNLPENLNSSQKTAIMRSLRADDFHLIQGPPGSGKTTVICEIAKFIIDKENRSPRKIQDDTKQIPLLITAFTNRAADNIVKKLHGQHNIRNEDIIRLGNLSNIIDEDVQMHTLEKLTARSNDRATKARELILKAKIVVTTNLSSTNMQISRFKFDMAIIDEASQSSEPMTLLPILQANRFILVGDHIQLPPVVPSSIISPALDKSVRKQLHIRPTDTIKLSLFERLMRKYGKNPKYASFLNIQYRMNEKIATFASKFYEKQIKSHNPVKDRSLSDFYDNYNIGCSVRGLAYKIFDPKHPLIWIDTQQLGWQQSKTSAMKSFFNQEEANFVANTLMDYLKGLRPKSVERLSIIAKEIGITTTYRAQVGEIRKKLYQISQDPKDAKYRNLIDKILIDTVDRFQGREKEVMLISLTDSNAERNVGELNKDKRRINVALTRGRSKVIFIGDSDTLTSVNYYQRLYSYIKKLNGTIKLRDHI